MIKYFRLNVAATMLHDVALRCTRTFTNHPRKENNFQHPTSERCVRVRQHTGMIFSVQCFVESRVLRTYRLCQPKERKGLTRDKHSEMNKKNICGLFRKFKVDVYAWRQPDLSYGMTLMCRWVVKIKGRHRGVKLKNKCVCFRCPIEAWKVVVQE